MIMLGNGEESERGTNDDVEDIRGGGGRGGYNNIQTTKRTDSREVRRTSNPDLEQETIHTPST